MEVIGVILNKVIGEKVDYITEFARRGFKRKGLGIARSDAAPADSVQADD